LPGCVSLPARVYCGFCDATSGEREAAEVTHHFSTGFCTLPIFTRSPYTDILRIGSDNAPNADAPRLLVCEDAPIERAGLSHLLRLKGYDVVEAADGEAAIASLSTEHFDLLLLDLTLPGTDGFGVLRFLKTHMKRLRVILLSGTSPERIQECMMELPDHELPPLLLKPVDPESVYELVEMQLSGALDGLEPGAGEKDLQNN